MGKNSVAPSLSGASKGDENLRPEKRRERHRDFAVSIQDEMKQKI